MCSVMKEKWDGNEDELMQILQHSFFAFLIIKL